MFTAVKTFIINLFKCLKLYNMATLFSDDFNRSNSTTLGGNWSEASGDWSITSNKLTTASSGGLAVNTTSLSTADYKVKAVCQSPGDSGGSGLIARYADSSNYYLAQLSYESNDVQIYKNVSGFTLLSSNGLTLNSATDYDVRFEVEGTALRLYVDDALITDTTDSALSAEGDFGARRGGGGDSQTWDDFVVEDFAAGGGGGEVTTVPFLSLLGVGA